MISTDSIDQHLQEETKHFTVNLSQAALAHDLTDHLHEWFSFMLEDIHEKTLEKRITTNNVQQNNCLLLLKK